MKVVKCRIKLQNFLPLLFAIILLTFSCHITTVNGQSVETYDNPLFGFKFQYPIEWNEVISEGQAGTAFSLYKLNDSEPFLYDTLGFMVLPTDTTNLRQYLRDINPMLNISSSTLKLVPTQLGGFSGMNATWINGHERFQFVYTIKDKEAYGSIYRADNKTYDKFLPEVTKVIRSFSILE